jgi:hypothetical protein
LAPRFLSSASHKPLGLGCGGAGAAIVELGDHDLMHQMGIDSGAENLGFQIRLYDLNRHR